VGARNRVGTGLVPWNQFLGALKFKKFGLWIWLLFCELSPWNRGEGVPWQKRGGEGVVEGPGEGVGWRVGVHRALHCTAGGSQKSWQRRLYKSPS
jgi:hypothetical protein